MGTQSSETVTAIVNPAAGGGTSLQRWRKVHAALQAAGVEVHVLVSSGPGHATVLARRALESRQSTLLAVGGDGTVHEIVNGLGPETLLTGEVRLGVVPAGTGMDFARSAGLRRGTQAAVERILHPNDRLIDIGIAEHPRTILFANFGETGIGATVVARQARSGQNLPGRASFLIAALDAIRRQANVSARIVVDDVTVHEGAVVSVVVANGRFFGGGMKIAPHASMDDGLLDVVILGDFSRAELLAQVWKIYPGVHVRHSKVATLRGKTVRVEMLAPSLLDLDGELYGEGQYTFSLLPRALRLMCDAPHQAQK